MLYRFNPVHPRLTPRHCSFSLPSEPHHSDIQPHLVLCARRVCVDHVRRRWEDDVLYDGRSEDGFDNSTGRESYFASYC
jgi:hypothetical protein